MINVSGLNMVTDSLAQQEIARLRVELEKLQGPEEVETSKGDDKNVKKNQRPGKPSASRKYVLLAKKLNSWGKVPQQQADIADLLSNGMEIGKEYSEAEVFNMLVDQCGEYTSIYSSKQDPTYLFRYYRGLKNDGKHAGFVAREFVRVIG